MGVAADRPTTSISATRAISRRRRSRVVASTSLAVRGTSAAAPDGARTPPRSPNGRIISTLGRAEGRPVCPRGRRLLSKRQESHRRGPVRRADHPDAVQLSHGRIQGVEANVSYQAGRGCSYANFAYAKAQGKDITPASSASIRATSTTSQRIISFWTMTRPTRARGASPTASSDGFPCRLQARRRHALRLGPARPTAARIPNGAH